MKSFAPVLGFISLLWLGLGTWWLSSMVCGGSDATTFTVVDGDFMAQSPDIFMFPISGDKMARSSGPETKAAFLKISKHLQDNPEKILSLTGVYGSNEKNETTFENLGVARAEKIKAFLVDLKAPIDQIITEGEQLDNLSFDKIVNKKKHMEGGVNFQFSAAGSNSSSDASENTDDATSSVTFSADSPMSLNISSKDFDLNNNADFQSYMASLATYITDNPGKKISITCYNRDKKLRKDIGRAIRSYMAEQLNFDADSQFSRYEKSLKDSPSGEASVLIGVK